MVTVEVFENEGKGDKSSHIYHQLKFTNTQPSMRKFQLEFTLQAEVSVRRWYDCSRHVIQGFCQHGTLQAFDMWSWL